MVPVSVGPLPVTASIRLLLRRARPGAGDLPRPSGPGDTPPAGLASCRAGRTALPATPADPDHGPPEPPTVGVTHRGQRHEGRAVQVRDVVTAPRAPARTVVG